MINIIFIPIIYFFFTFLIYKFNEKKIDFFLNYLIYTIYCASFFLLVFLSHDLINNDVNDYYNQGKNFSFKINFSSYLGAFFEIIISILSLLLFNFMNVFFFIVSLSSISILFLIKICNYLNFSTPLKLISVSLFFLSPISLAILSSGHREIIEILFISILTYLIVSIESRSIFMHYFFLLSISLILFFLHKTYIIFIVFFIIYFLIYSNLNFNIKNLFFLIIFLLFITLFLYFFQNDLLEEIDFYNIVDGNPNLSFENLLHFIKQYRDNVGAGSGVRLSRTFYDFSTNDFLIIEFINIYISYLFTPLMHFNKFFSVFNFLDYLYLIHIYFRILAVCIILIFFNHLDFKIINLLIMFLIISFIWSLGTTNYGTAIRHNLSSDFLILVSSCYIIQNILKKKNIKD